jgi:hypothetical protein
MALTHDPNETRARSALFAAAATSILGLAVAGTVSRTVGGIVLVTGWLAFVYALHSLGRAGDSGD